ncbi:MAG TPA: DUF6691 family protein [Bryobacteraceae bacterium]
MRLLHLAENQHCSLRIAEFPRAQQIGVHEQRWRTPAFISRTTVRLPVNRIIMPRLIVGSAAFGVGWGLAGFCPGPALVAMGAGYLKAVGFVAAMVAGMTVFELVGRAKSATRRA